MLVIRRKAAHTAHQPSNPERFAACHDCGGGRFDAQSDRRKFRRSCLLPVDKPLKLLITALASEPESAPPVACDWIAEFKSPVLPSCRKYTLCPNPQSGAVRNSLGPA